MEHSNINRLQKTYRDETERKEDIIDFVQIFKSFLNHWFIILLGTLLLGAVAFLGSVFLITPLYASTSQLYVLNKSTDTTTVSDVQTSTSLTNDYIVVVTDRPVIEEVKKKLQLDLSYREIVDKITVKNPSNSRLLNITVKDADAKLAKKMADELADVVSKFIAEKMDQAPPSVTSYGYIEDHPVSPNKKMNALIGAVIGFLLTTVTSVIRDLSKDVIMNQTDIEEKLGIFMLSAIPYEENILHKKDRRKKKK